MEPIPTRGSLKTVDITTFFPTIKMLAVSQADNFVYYWDLESWTLMGGGGPPPFTLPYKIFTGLVFQAGTGNPTVQTYQNTLTELGLGNINWIREGVGTYSGHIVDGFSDKGWYMIGDTKVNANTVEIFSDGTDGFVIRTYINGTLSDNVLDGVSIEVRRYD